MPRQSTPDILGPILTGDPRPTELRIADIRRDGATQPRAGLDAAHVEDMIAALTDGETLPPIDVMFDGSFYWVYDGFHRISAHERLGRLKITAIVHQGAQADAQWESYAVNKAHGLKRTNEDKKRQSLAALRHPRAASLSNTQIAKHVGVDEGTIRHYRAQLEVTSEIPTSSTRTGADGRIYNTEKIGQTAKPDAAWAPIWQLEYAVAAIPDVTAPDLRQAAKAKAGPLWDDIEHRVAQKHSIMWRKTDLVQAIHNVAARWEARGRAVATPPVTSVPAATPAAMPTDLTARGWELRQLSSGRYYCNNQDRARATAVWDRPEDAIKEARSMQIDVTGPTVANDDTAGSIATGDGIDDQAQPPAPILRVRNDNLFKLAEESHSAAKLSNNQIAAPFHYMGRNWVMVGGRYRGNKPEGDALECIRVQNVTEDIEPGERVSTYVPTAYLPGTLVHHGKNRYLLGAQWLIVQRATWETVNTATVVDTTRYSDTADASEGVQTAPAAADDASGATAAPSDATADTVTKYDADGYRTRKMARMYVDTAIQNLKLAKGVLGHGYEMCEQIDALLFDLNRMYGDLK